MQEPADQHPGPTALQRLADLSTSAGGALIGYQVGDLEGSVIGNAAAPAVALAWHLGNRALRARLTRGSQTLDIAAQILGVDLDNLAARATADDARLELLARVLEAAGRTPLPEKIPALGRVLADGLTEGSLVDDARILADALDDIEAPHVRALLLLRDEAVGPRLRNDRGAQGAVGWETDEIAERLGAPVVGPQLVRTLERHALIRDASRGVYFDEQGDTRYTLTPLGQTCLALLRGQD